MINSYNLYVDFLNGIIEPDRPIKIVKNDSDSILLKFKIKNAESERKVIKFLFPDGTGCIKDLENDELILSAGTLKAKGTIRFELSLYNKEQRLTNYALGSMFIRDELLSEDTMIQEDDRLPILTALINKIENFKVDDVDGGNADTNYSINGGGA